MADVKADYRYTKEHEWVHGDEEALIVGVTAFAVEQLGDITLIDLSVEVGSTIKAGEVFGTIESVKTLSDLFSPVDGEVVEINPALEDTPELINEDCWEAGWLIKVKPSASNGSLMSAQDYKSFTDEQK